MKHAEAVAAKQSRDAGTVDLLAFFLQTKSNEEEKLLIIKLTGEVFLLLVECDESKWRKILRKENGKWILHVLRNKIAHGTLNTVLMAHKNLAKALQEWGMVMKLHDPRVGGVEEMKKQLALPFHIDGEFLAHV